MYNSSMKVPLKIVSPRELLGLVPSRTPNMSRHIAPDLRMPVLRSSESWVSKHFAANYKVATWTQGVDIGGNTLGRNPRVITHSSKN